MKSVKCYLVFTIFYFRVLSVISRELLNFQILVFTEENVELEILQDDSCHLFVAEILYVPEGEEIDIDATVYRVLVTGNRVAIPREELFNNTEYTFLRLTALNLDGSICSSSQSQNTLYRFASETIMEVPVGSETVIPVPVTHCPIPTIIWRRFIAPDGKNCHCIPIQANHYSFSNCVQLCGTDFDVSLFTNATSRSVVFHHLDEILEPFLVHFTCDEYRNGFILSTITTYQLIVMDESPLTTQSTDMDHTKTISATSEVVLSTVVVAVSLFCSCCV